MTVTAKRKAAENGPPVDARQLMDELNADAGELNIWVRTELNAPAQRAWFTDTGGVTGAGQLAKGGRVAANQMKTLPCQWRWKDYGPFLERIEAIANTGCKDAVIYTTSDAALMRNIGQYRAQGKAKDGSVVQLVS